MENLKVVVMAGGKGERFFPLSTTKQPKPFLKLFDGKSLFELTIQRLKKKIPPSKIYVVLSQQHLDIAKEQANENINYILEPESRDTAACIGFCSLFFKSSDVMVVLPADHFIKKEEDFLDAILSAGLLAKQQNKTIIFGIKPTRPETGYGHIKKKRFYKKEGRWDVYEVECFVEKPTFEKAKEFTGSGNYLWNCGIFVWKASLLKSLIEKHMPKHHKILSEIDKNKDDAEFVKRKYREFERISIDYGVMEKERDILVFECDFGWDDVGNWDAVYRILEKDENGNVILGEGVFMLDCEDNLVYCEDGKLYLWGIKGHVVIKKQEKVFISPRRETIELKKFLTTHKIEI